jgi:hypothetical protein
MICHICLCNKDLAIKEVYPYEEDGLIDEPIDPIIKVDVQPEDGDEANWRIAQCCHKCFHDLNVDMWISERCLKVVGSKTPFTELPYL